MLIKFVVEKKELWEHFLDTCVFAYNTAHHESSQYSPFEVMFGRKAVLPVDVSMGEKKPDVVLEKHLQKQELSTSQVLLYILPFCFG